MTFVCSSLINKSTRINCILRILLEVIPTEFIIVRDLKIIYQHLKEKDVKNRSTATCMLTANSMVVDNFKEVEYNHLVVF